MPSIVECQKLVWELEEQKGFGHNLDDKLLWMGEEYGELIHAFKHGDLNKLAEEATDVTFFTATALQSLNQNGDLLATSAKRTMEFSQSIPFYIRELGKTYGKILDAADQFQEFNGCDVNDDLADLVVNKLSAQLIKMHLYSRELVRITQHDADTEFVRKLNKNYERIPVVHGTVRHFDRE